MKTKQTKNTPRKSKYILIRKRSSAGLGLFAGEDIPRGVFIVEYFGPLLSSDDADEKGGKYLFAVNSKWTIDGSARNNLARYINHSCNPYPNCETEIQGKKVFIYSIKKIKKGEELTYDYGKEYFDEHIKPYSCRCKKHQI